MRIVTIVGARPQFIKAAVVSRALASKKNIEEIIIHTGQHYDDNMSAIFFDEMKIQKPIYNLAIKESLHGAMTAKMIEGIEQILIDLKSVLVLVYGDTNSTLAASLAASKLNINIAHIEAGLRSFNMQMPEEINRIIADRLSKFLFCPTQNAIINLEKEGFLNFDCSIFLTGDVMLDAAKFYFKNSTSDIIQKLKLEKEKYFLCTIHRAENTNDNNKLKSIVEALNVLNKHYKVIVPLHPRTVKYLAEYHIQTDFQSIQPVGYFDMLQLISNCKIILTDSGGLQKEAFFFQKFCVTLRNETEWTELVEHDCNKVVGSNKENIIEAVNYFLTSTFNDNLTLYGDGKAGEKIADLIESSIFAAS